MAQLFVASRTRGLAVRLDEELVFLDEAPGLNSLEFHQPSNTLYGISGEKVFAWRVTWNEQARRPEVRRIAESSSGGKNSCHLRVVGRLLAIANYDSGTVSCLQLSETGEFAGPPALLRWSGAGPDRERQMQPHPHQIHAAPFGGFGVPDGIVVIDLGSDALVVFSPDDLSLAVQWAERDASAEVSLDEMLFPPMIATPAGSGPRHAVALSTGAVAISAELSSEVLFRQQGESWRAIPSTLFPSALEGRNFPSDIVLHSSGTVIVANRGNDTLTFLTVEGEIYEYDAGGRWPQSLAVLANELLIACEREDRVTVMRLDQVSGLPMSEAIEALDCPAPSCVVFV